jgi:hypothetical protein
MQLSGDALSRIVWALSPFYTVVLAYLLPLIMAARGWRLRDAVASSWIAVICIFFFEYYLLPFLMLRYGVGSESEKIEIPDTMPGMAMIILFGWIPGIIMAVIGSCSRWCFRRWKERTHVK